MMHQSEANISVREMFCLLLKQLAAFNFTVTKADLCVFLPQVHKLEKKLWDQTQVVNINIADSENINPKVMHLVYERCLKFRWTLLNGSTCVRACFQSRNTRKNWTQPNSSRRRRVEAPWDQTGRSDTVVHDVAVFPRGTLTLKLSASHLSCRRSSQRTAVALTCAPTSSSRLRPRCLPLAESWKASFRG